MRYRFEDFDFDPDSGLSRSGTPVALEPLAAALLHLLIENRGRIVTRDELNERLWGGRIVSDAALSTQIRGVRRALGDDREQQRFIKTHPKRGFAFVAPVERIEVGTAAATPRTTPGAPAATGGEAPVRGVAQDARPWRRLASPWIAAAGLGLLALVALGLWTGREAITTGAEPPRSLSIAVLPFDNLSGDASMDYLADAFTEDLITDLSRIRDAFVISRSTTFTYRGKEVDATSVARELGVRYVLEGSLRVDGDSVRINAQLIDGKTNRHIWSDRYERTLADLFDVRDNVTGRIASVLRAELRVADSERQDPELTKDAWDYALRGNVILYNHESIADYQEAHALLTRAVELDPTISSAWGGLAFVHAVASLTTIPGVSRADSAALSLDAARKAVEADPKNAEPYWLVGLGLARNGRPEQAMAACETAIDLNPNMDCGYVCAGLVHMARDEPEKAVPHFQYALRLNPRFRPFTKEKYLGLAYIQSGRDKLAIEALNRALARAPKDTFANLALAAALALDGQMPEAREALHRYAQNTGEQPPTIASLRRTLGWMGPKTERMFGALRDAGAVEG
jgi:TolB-like protein/DNA-binding winged helix-turn-helix (wHTH) protein/Tfp pilus assembly protein PilF